MSETRWRTEARGPDGGLRLDRLWAGRLAADEVSRSEIQEWIRSGLATIDGRECTRPGQRVAPGQVLELRGVRGADTPAPVAGEIAVRYADDSLAILDKPAGLVIHPAPSVRGTTLVNLLLHHYPQLSDMEGFRPGIVHRLDKDTSGLVAVALKRRVRDELSRAFAERRVVKEYLTVVHGKPDPPQGEIRLALGRHPQQKTRMAVLRSGGRDAVTRYETLRSFSDGEFSLVRVRILTGRTHQVRVHLSHLGHPLAGDALYGGGIKGTSGRERVLARLASRQMLHAFRLGLTHPETGEDIDLLSPPPPDFRLLLCFLNEQCQRIGLTGLPGSGKSSLLSVLAGWGFPVWSADDAVRELYKPGADGWIMLRKRFGERFTPAPRLPVDRKGLQEAMAGDSRVLREVEKLIHPLVEHAMTGFFAAHRDKTLAVAEVPLLAEKGWTRGAHFDLTVGMYMDQERRRRILESKGWSEAMIGLAESRQWSQRDKLRSCDLVLDNSGGPELLEHRARTLLRVLRAIRVRGRRRQISMLENLWKSEIDHGRSEPIESGQ
jgi:23S rRNA pseudouridine1911/1915/1917 synthase